MKGLRANSLIGISIAIFVLIAVSGLLIIYFTGNIEEDANAINSAGVIRGTIQRIAKLELNGTRSDEMILATDRLISEFLSHRIYFVEEGDKFQSAMGELNTSWEYFKDCVYSYRSSNTYENKLELIAISEKMWELCNETVKIAQYISEKKISYYKILLIFIVFILFILGIIIISLKIYVRDKLEYLTIHDVLTGVYNRLYFNEYLKNTMKDADRAGTSLCLVILDIDHFKKVNDSFGHHRGDCVLKEIAELTSKCIRQNDALARIGGEEFAIILTNTTSEGAMKVAEKVRQGIYDHSFTEVGKITISLGVALYKNGQSAEIFFKNADEALYRAKNNGRNRVEINL